MKRVYILAKQSMFGLGIETLLSQSPDIEIVSQCNEITASIESIKTSRPDVVIVNCDEPDPEMKSIVMDILRDQVGMTVIGLSLRNNRISIYRGEKKDVCQVEDLLKVIQD